MSLVKSAGHTERTVQLLHFGKSWPFWCWGFEPSLLRGKDDVRIGILLKWDFSLTVTGSQMGSGDLSERDKNIERLLIQKESSEPFITPPL